MHEIPSVALYAASGDGGSWSLQALPEFSVSFVSDWQFLIDSTQAGNFLQ